MKKINLAQGSQEWLDFRRTKIGASEAPKILGISPYMTAHQLWMEKTGRRPPKADNVAMEFGRRKENQIREYWEQKNEDFYQPAVVASDAHDFCMASLDGMSSNQARILECKCVNADAWNTIAEGNVVDHHYAQAQHQLMVTGCECVEFVYYHGGEYRSAVVTPDEEYIQKMLEAEKKFYQYMIDDEEPPLSERDYLDMSKDADWTSLEIQAKYLYEKYKNFEKQWKELQGKFKDLSNNMNCAGDVIKTTVVNRKGNICTKKMHEDGIDLEKYRRGENTSIRITINLKG